MPSSAMTAATASATLTPRWSLRRMAMDGTARQVTTCAMTDSDTIAPAVVASKPRSRRIGASQPKTQ